MRIQIMSDIHIRHWINKNGVMDWLEDFPKATQTDADVLVLAGDAVDLDPRRWRWSRERLTELCARYQNVVYVPGNHEYYGTSIWDVSESLLDLEDEVPGLEVLYPGRTVLLGKQEFIGGTMFQPWDDKAPWISDHHCISDFQPEAAKHYAELRAWLEKMVKPDSIVVTHHAPSVGSIDAQFRGDPHNRWFITPEMESLIESHHPKMWIHGHVHSSWDYFCHGTRVICNPRGYIGENPRFNPKLIVEV